MQVLPFTVSRGVHMNRLAICILGERREIPVRVAFPKLSIDIKSSSVCKLLLTMFLVQISLFLFTIHFTVFLGFWINPTEVYRNIWQKFRKWPLSTLVCVNPRGLQSDREFGGTWAKYFCDFSAILKQYQESAATEMCPFFEQI